MTGSRDPVPIAVRGLGIRYPDRPDPVLDRIDLDVAPGERVLLAGPSGAGKSTLALAIAGLVPGSVEADYRGAVRIGAQPVPELEPGAAAELVGVVFQDPASQFTLPRVEDEVAFGLENLGRPPAIMPAAVERALRAVGLLDRRGWLLDRLSGGQQQRVALAATLAVDPAIVVLDEPSAHLDPRSADELYAWIGCLTATRGRTLIAIEHGLDRVVPRLVERCVVLDRAGRVALDGSVESVLGSVAGARRCAELGVWLPAPARLALALGADGALPLDVDAAARWIARDQARARRLRDAGIARQASGRTSRCAGGAPPVLEATGVTVAYRARGGELVAVRGADLAVRPGEFVAIVGPNGSGKSSLLRALGGALPPAAGSITVAGRLLRPGAADPRAVGSVFQNPEAGLLASTVGDEVAYGPRALGWPEADVRHASTAILERLGLARLADANPFTLSQGEKRRLSIAAAAVSRPAVLLLDEPTFGQDARSAAALVAEIDALRAEGVAVIVATHDVELVAEVADRVVAIADGAIVAETTPAVFLADERLLRATRQVRPPLGRILESAAELGADVPLALRWRDVECAGRTTFS